MDGIGSSGSSGNAAGVRLNAVMTGSISTTSGKIQVTGVGGGGTTNNDGVLITNMFDVSTVDGSIAIIGNSTSASSGSDGVEISAGASMEATGAGSVTVTGTAGAGANNGILIDTKTHTETGSLDFTGTGTTGGSGIALNTNAIVGDPAQSGDLSLRSNGLAFNGASVVQGTGKLIVDTLDAGGAINVGAAGGASEVDLSTSNISHFATTFNSIVVGRADGTGTITLNSPTFANATVTVESPISGTIVVNGFAVSGHGGAVFTAPAITLAGTVTTVNSDIAFNGTTTIASNQRVSAGTGAIALSETIIGANKLSLTGNVAFQNNAQLSAIINGSQVGQYGQFVVVGLVNLNSAQLAATINYTPTVGDSLTLIDNDGADTVVGTFSGLANGALVNGGPLAISYGNDVILKVNVNAAPVITSFSATPTQTTVGTTVTFTVSASDPDSPTLTTTFNYGDGTSGSVDTHVYNTPGVYTVVVTVSDGTNTVTSQVTITVVAASALDFRVGVRFNLGAVGAGKDRIHVGGIIYVPRALNLAGQTVTLNVGGNVETFVLNEKGAGKSATTGATFALRLSKNRGETHFVVNIRNANYQSKLLLNTPLNAVGLPQSIPITLMLDGIDLTSPVPLKFTGRPGHYNGLGINIRPLAF